MKNLLSLALLWLLALVPALAQTTPEARSVASFRAVEVSSGIELRLVAGATQLVEVSADTPELRARIQTVVSDGVLKVSFEYRRGEVWGKNKRSRRLQVNVTAPTPLTALKASSGAAVTVAGAFAPDSLQLDLSSGATLKADLTATTVRARLSSGGIATLTGKIQRLDVRTSSGAVFEGADLQAATCTADASSGGIITVAVQQALTAEASSGGDVRYRGSPQLTKHTSSGGSVSGR